MKGEMITKLHLSAVLLKSPIERCYRFPESDRLCLEGDGVSSMNSSQRLENRQREDGPELLGLWTGTRDGVVSTAVAMVAALLFGGSAGAWFAPTESGWLDQILTISVGTMVMGILVCLIGSILSGRNPIFWGIGMPLLVYVAGSFAAFISGHAGATAFWFGAPLFCGLAILAGVMTAFALDRGR